MDILFVYFARLIKLKKAEIIQLLGYEIDEEIMQGIVQKMRRAQVWRVIATLFPDLLANITWLPFHAA
jgi:hypothetical protein